MTKKYQIVFMIVFIMTGIISTVAFCNNRVYAQDMSVTVPATCYEGPHNKEYKIENDRAVPVMSYGDLSIGSLNISGANISNSTYAGTNAYGVSGNVSFSYTYSDTMLTESETGWYIINDDAKKIDDRKFNDKILMGSLTIQKKYKSDEEYVDAANPVLNFFETTPSGKILYTTAGNDVARGTYYRIVLAYKTRVKTGTTLWWNNYDTKRNIEVYEFYIVENSGIISIHNLSADEEIIDQDEYTQELLKHGETLLDGSVTRDGFKIDNPASSYTITVQHNDNKAITAKNGDIFREDGKYVVNVKTKLNKTVTTNLYVFSGGDDRGYKEYFGDNFVQAERVFRKEEYPTYARGGRLRIKAVDADVPTLFGTVTDLNAGKEVHRFTGLNSEQSYSLKPGFYQVDLYNGDKDAPGSIYHYNFVFYVIDEESAPYVNYNNLTHSEELKDLETKHYEVAYQTTQGGYVFVCFSMDSYEEAMNYAREIEGRYVEAATGGGYYYKSESNPNRKVKYYDQIELTRVSEIYAKQNVEINYFNATDAFTYKTYNNDLLDTLEKINVNESIKVFPSQEEKEKMIDRAPFLNGFTFIQATDYDVTSIQAVCDVTGESKKIEFGIPVDEQLTDTSIYHITETNKYGRTKKYDAYFLGDCQTEMGWSVVRGGNTRKISITCKDANEGEKTIVDADVAYVDYIKNQYDKWAIVNVKAPEVYSVELKCLVSEFKNLAFAKAGYYELSLIDRIGNHYEIAFNISGKADVEELEKSVTSYAEFYNTIYENQIDVREDTTELKILEAEKDAEETEIENELQQDSFEESAGEGEDYDSTKGTDEGLPADDQERTIEDEKKPDRKGDSGIIWILLMIAGFSFVMAIVIRKKTKAKHDAGNADISATDDNREDGNNEK